MDQSSSPDVIKDAVKAAGIELGLDQDMYLEILKEALGMAQGDMKNLYQALSTEDYDQIKAIAHRLKGTFANLRCESLAVIMKNIDIMALNKQPVADIKPEVEKFDKELILYTNI